MAERGPARDGSPGRSSRWLIAKELYALVATHSLPTAHDAADDFVSEMKRLCTAAARVAVVAPIKRVQASWEALGSAITRWVVATLHAWGNEAVRAIVAKVAESAGKSDNWMVKKAVGMARDWVGARGASGASLLWGTERSRAVFTNYAEAPPVVEDGAATWSKAADGTVTLSGLRFETQCFDIAAGHQLAVAVAVKDGDYLAADKHLSIKLHPANCQLKLPVL